MKSFEFTTDQEAFEFCMEIANVMVRDFAITTDEAIARMNRLWRGLSFGGPEELLFHELPETWAYDIYFGKGSAWWTKPEAQRLPLPPP